MGRSGDPRKRPGAHGTANVVLFWQPFHHKCGCYLEWGTEVPRATEFQGARAQESMFRFLKAIKDYPCPLHGSMTGIPAPPLGPEERRYLDASGVWYKQCPPESYLYADRLRTHLEEA